MNIVRISCLGYWDVDGTNVSLTYSEKEGLKAYAVEKKESALSAYQIGVLEGLPSELNQQKLTAAAVKELQERFALTLESATKNSEGNIARLRFSRIPGFESIVRELSSLELAPRSHKFTSQILGKHESTTRSLQPFKGGILVSGGGDGKLKYWNLQDARCTKSIKATQWGIISIAPLTNNLFGLCVIGSPLSVWDQADDKLKVLTEHDVFVRCVASHTSGIFASGSNDATVRIWNSKTLQCVSILTGHQHYVDCVAFINGQLVSGSFDKTIKIWDVNKGSVRLTLTGHEEEVSCLLDLGVGKFASGSGDNSIKIWDLASGKCEHTIRGLPVPPACFTNVSGGRFASGSCDGMIRIWDKKSYQCLAEIPTRQDQVLTLATMEDGTLISGHFTGTLLCWKEV